MMVLMFLSGLITGTIIFACVSVSIDKRTVRRGIWIYNGIAYRIEEIK